MEQLPSLQTPPNHQNGSASVVARRVLIGIGATIATLAGLITILQFIGITKITNPFAHIFAQPTATATRIPPTATPLLGTGVRYRLISNSDVFCSNGSLVPFEFLLDNQQGTRSVPWKITIVDKDPKGKIWASSQPASGTLAPGKQQNIKIVPNPSLCNDLPHSLNFYNFTFKATVGDFVVGPIEVTIGADF